MLLLVDDHKRTLERLIAAVVSLYRQPPGSALICSSKSARPVEAAGAMAPTGAVVVIGAGAGASTARRFLLRASAPAHQ